MNPKNSSIVPTKIRTRFINGDRPGYVTEKVISLYKEDHLLIPCLHRECVRGGFDLRGINDWNLQQPKIFVCSGWQDKERVNQNRCLCELHVEVLDYQSE